jgi:hypothetical protein
MFRKNDRHRQKGPASPPTPLPEKQRRRLEESWAGCFYREFFCRIEEGHFAVLYSSEPSRPNAPVNVLVGAEVLKAGFGWSDEELADALQFNLQVRYALGLRDWEEGDFVLRTLYNFRRRLVQHMQATGENLLAGAFEQVTDEQIAAWKLSTAVQRMDSTLIASNIRNMSRLQLLVEVLQRVYRMLHEADQQREEAALAPYRRGTSGQYCYHLHGADIPGHMERIGQLMQRLVRELAATYGEDPVYLVLCRVFREHFAPGDGDDPPPSVEHGPALRVKTDKEVGSQSLQSPDDLEATYRNKGGLKHRGYVLNLSETCAPDNPFQLITQLQVAPNHTDDGVLLQEALPQLKARTGVRQLWNDGSYSGPEVERALRRYEVEQLLTAIRGGKPGADQLNLAAFAWEVDAAEQPQAVTCPGGQRADVGTGRHGRHIVHFAGASCATCALAGRCRAQPLRNGDRSLRLDARDVAVARRRQVVAQVQNLAHNLRAAIEATVRSCKHPVHGKVPVRGQKRVTMFCLATALLVNVKRIWRYQVAQGQAAAAQAADLLLFRLPQLLRQRLQQLWLHRANSWTVQSVYG